MLAKIVFFMGDIGSHRLIFVDNFADFQLTRSVEVLTLGTVVPLVVEQDQKKSRESRHPPFSNWCEPEITRWMRKGRVHNEEVDRSRHGRV